MSGIVSGNEPTLVPPAIFRLDPMPAAIYTTSMSDDTEDRNILPATLSEPLSRAIGERYLTYALSTIMQIGRAHV